jgi:glucose/arabinose dehydrogenase
VRTATLALLLALALAFATPARAAPALVHLGDFAQPTYATTPPGDTSRVFVTERAGTLRLLGQTAPFLDLSAIVESGYVEQGLLSVAFAPDYATSGRFYVYLTAKTAAAVSGTSGEIQIREYRRSAADPNLADPASARILLSIPHTDALNHNGGQLQFGPDGLLWAGTGDGGGADNQFGHSQDQGSMLGKLLKIDPSQQPAVTTVVARGLRNPWRFSFDRASGQIAIADVGQGQIEEVDVGLAANYGWPCFEGSLAYHSDPGCDGAQTAMPVIQRNHTTDGYCAIVGGYVVHDPALPTLAGRYIYGDDCATALRSANLANPADDVPVGLSVTQLSSFGEDACGRIFVVSLAGPVSRLGDGDPSACYVAPTPASPATPAPGQGVSTGTPGRPCVASQRITGLRSAGRRARLSLALRADQPCRVTITAAILGVTRFRVATAALVRGRRTVVSLRLTHHGATLLRAALRRHRRPAVALTIQAVDARGNAGIVNPGRVRIRA